MFLLFGNQKKYFWFEQPMLLIASIKNEKSKFQTSPYILPQP